MQIHGDNTRPDVEILAPIRAFYPGSWRYADPLLSHRRMVMAEGGHRNHGVRDLMAGPDDGFAERQGKKLVFQEGIGKRVNGLFLHPSRLEDYRSAGIL